MVNVSGKKKALIGRSSGFVYQPRSAEAIKKRAERQGGRFDSPFKQGVDLWRAKGGDNLIRILPPTWKKADHYAYTIFVHSYVGAENSTYLCPAKMVNKPCPICKASKVAKDAGEMDEAKALQWTEKMVCYIIDRDDDDLSPQLYVMSWTMDRDIAALCHQKRTGKVLLIDDPDEGYDLTIKRTGQGLKTRYFGLAVDRDPSPIADKKKKQEEILDYITENPIPSLLNYHDTAYLQKVVEGTADEVDEDLDTEEEVEDEKAPRTGRRPGRVSAKDEEEEVEEDEEEEVEEEADADGEASEDEEVEEETEDEEVEEEEEEEEERPRARRGKRAAEPEEEEEVEEDEVEEEEVEDEVEEEEEEEEAPRSRRTVKPRRPVHRTSRKPASRVAPKGLRTSRGH